MPGHISLLVRMPTEQLSSIRDYQDGSIQMPSQDGIVRAQKCLTNLSTVTSQPGSPEEQQPSKVFLILGRNVEHSKSISLPQRSPCLRYPAYLLLITLSTPPTPLPGIGNVR